MSSLLDNYLEEVAKRLSMMPEAMRDDHLTEIRTHLDAAVAAQGERGDTEIDSQRAAIKNFGPAKQVASKLAYVWRSGQKHNPVLDLFGIPLCIAFIYALTKSSESIVVYCFKPHWHPHSFWWTSMNLPVASQGVSKMFRHLLWSGRPIAW